MILDWKIEQHSLFVILAFYSNAAAGVGGDAIPFNMQKSCPFVTNEIIL